MKKLIGSVAIIVIVFGAFISLARFPANAVGGWIDNGSGITYQGTVGIGTTSPKARLDIHEIPGITGILFSDNGAPAGKQTFRFNEEGGTLQVQTLSDDATAWQASLMVLNHNGDICIGKCI